MTPIFLLENLTDFIKERTSDIKLQVRTRNNPKEEKRRAAEVYQMGLPNKDAEIQRIPYILLQLISGKDDKKEHEPAESMCQIRIVVGTYSEDIGEGKKDVLNLLLRIRSELEKIGIIGELFVLQNPLEYIVYPDNTAPFYFGEMITNWSIPVIKREVEKIWQ